MFSWESLTDQLENGRQWSDVHDTVRSSLERSSINVVSAISSSQHRRCSTLRNSSQPLINNQQIKDVLLSFCCHSSPSAHICLHVRPSVCACQFTCPSVYSCMSMNNTTARDDALIVRLSVSVRLFSCPPVCVSVCLPLSTYVRLSGSGWRGNRSVAGGWGTSAVVGIEIRSQN